MTVLLALLVVAGVVAMLAYPLFRPGAQPPPDPVGPAAAIAALQERKLQVYSSIRELGFDYRMDKLETADYEEEVDKLKGEAIELVREIDVLSNRPPRGSDELEAEIEAAGRLEGAAPGTANGSAGGPDAANSATGAALFCTRCGAEASDVDRFCSACGAALRHSE